MALRHLIFPAWIFGAVLPRLYNEFGLAISGPVGGAEFQSWPAAFSWLTERVIGLVPALAATAAEVYPQSAPEHAALLHYAAIDLAWIAIFAVTTILLLAPWMLVPAPFNALYPNFRERIKGGRRILVILGSISMCLLALIFAFTGVFEVFHGDVVADAHRYCSISDGWGKRSRCIAHANHDFAGTVRKLGWLMSMIGGLAGLVFWAILASLRYAYWAATWKGRRSRFS